ncbi:MAG: helix-turn-helix domain-containing protein [Clostridiales bacterium]|nr:helix-turn-helix domain-containing protein [Clostridiales bacterium]
MTQCETILNYIEEHGSITARQAYKLGIMRLASRISDLKKAGFDIKSDTIKVKCRDGSVSYVSRYSMNKKEAKP